MKLQCDKTRKVEYCCCKNVHLSNAIPTYCIHTLEIEKSAWRAKIGRGKTTGIQNYPASNIVYYVDIKTVLKIFQMHLASPERFYEPGAPFSSVEDGVPSGLDARNSFSYIHIHKYKTYSTCVRERTLLHIRYIHIHTYRYSTFASKVYVNLQNTVESLRHNRECLLKLSAPSNVNNVFVTARFRTSGAPYWSRTISRSSSR